MSTSWLAPTIAERNGRHVERDLSERRTGPRFTTIHGERACNAGVGAEVAVVEEEEGGVVGAKVDDNRDLKSNLMSKLSVLKSCLSDVSLPPPLLLLVVAIGVTGEEEEPNANLRTMRISSDVNRLSSFGVSRGRYTRSYCKYRVTLTGTH